MQPHSGAWAFMSLASFVGDDFGRRDFGLNKAAWRKSCEETSKRSLHCSAVFECVFDYRWGHGYPHL